MLKKNIIKKDVFNREVAMCKMLNKQKGGCCWGKCKACGVIPLLYKLHKGQLLEKPAEIRTLRSQNLVSPLKRRN